MLIQDKHGDYIARHHEGIQINSMLLAIKLIAAFLRHLEKINWQKQELGQEGQVKTSEPVKMTAKLDGKPILSATLEQDLLTGTEPGLLKGNSSGEISQGGLPPFPDLPLLESVNYINAEVLENYANSLVEIVELPPESSYEEPTINTFEVVDENGQYLINYQNGRVEENTLYNPENKRVVSQTKNLPEKRIEQASLKTENQISNERLSELAHIILQFRDPEEGKRASGRNYQIENREGVISISAQDGRGEIFSDQNGKNRFSAQDYENFGKIDQFITEREQRRQQQLQMLTLSKTNQRERELSL